MKVTNMISPKTGRSIPNQFIIEDWLQDSEICYKQVFQSYDSAIVEKVTFNSGATETRLDPHYWDYSVTTGKYRNQFLGETKAETQKKIDSGEYVLVDLNGG